MGIFGKNKHSQKRAVFTSNKQIEQTLMIPENQENTPDSEHHEEMPVSEKLWEKCPKCQHILYKDDVKENLLVCSSCGYHFRLSARKRIRITADEGSFVEFNENLIGGNPLDFPGYQEKIDGIREKTKQKEGIVTGECTIGGQPCVIAVMDSYFMMGSMGAAVGEKFALAAERAIEKKLPLVAFTTSGGARMQEGLVSLMQMAKTSAMVAKLDEAGLLYLVVLTDPTTGGVTASFAMLGDIMLAEPKATVGFAGRRVIEQTVKQTLPDEFQTSEFVLEKGFIDMIVDRKDLKDTIAKILKMHSGGEAK